MKKKINNIIDIVDSHLCSGCGACAYLVPESLVMVDKVNAGFRPRLKKNKVTECLPQNLLDVCPSWNLERTIKEDKVESIGSLYDEWGVVYEVWEAYAADEEIRRSGSSGGVITALSLFCLEQKKMGGVLNTSFNPEKPFLNQSKLIVTQQQLLKTTGSRYSPSSPCEQLHLIENASSPCAFIGKPCDAAAVQKIRKLNNKLDKNIGLVVSFFCAGVPSTAGTTQLLKKNSINDLSKLISLRYRGNGWPGFWSAKFSKDNKTKEKKLTYQESWGFLQKFRQWRCYICPDHSGEFSDIAVGDPWYKKIKKGELGRSMIVVRTPLGRAIVQEAARKGYIILEKSDPNILPLSQPNLIKSNGAMWGKLLVLKIFNVPSPKYIGFNFFKGWILNLSFKEKIQSTFGTIKRIYGKELKRKE